MVCFPTKNSNLGKFCEGLAKEDVGICILWTSGVFYEQLIYFVLIWYFPPFGVCIIPRKNLATLETSQFFVLKTFFSLSLSSLCVLRSTESRCQECVAQFFFSKGLKQKKWKFWNPGVDVMITYFCDFCHFWRKNMVFFL
jgi:hypothetical protein